MHVSNGFFMAFDPIFLKLACNNDIHNIWDEFEFGQIQPPTTGVADVECLKNI